MIQHPHLESFFYLPHKVRQYLSFRGGKYRRIEGGPLRHGPQCFHMIGGFV